MGMTGSDFGSRSTFVLPGGTVPVRSISSRSVLAPTQPSAFTFSCLAWNAFTACSVCGPQLPSATMFLPPTMRPWPEINRAFWIQRT